MEPNSKLVSVKIPFALWRHVKVYCLENDMTIKKFIMEAIVLRLNPK
jgi:hypothetical protein